MNEDTNLSELERASRDVLIGLWRSHVQSFVPRSLSRPLMIRAIAWALQAKQFGGHRPATLACLGKRADGATVRRVAAGTKLIREWHGMVHEVTVLENGFDYRGEAYKSLSAIARKITGTRWSGPRFFGLNC